MTMDTINGLFEIGGALITLLSLQRLRRDRAMMGFHWGPTIFFTVWGLWNILYYPHLDQPVSTVGAVLLVAVNLAYLGLMVHVSQRRCRRDVRHHPNCRCECATIDGILHDHRPHIFISDVPLTREAEESLQRRADAIRLAGERMRMR